MQTIIMKNLIKQFADILNSPCLNTQEKNHLKKQFNLFMERRNLISRQSISSEHEDDMPQVQDWQSNNFG